MFLDVANPSVIDGIDGDDLIFVLIAAIIRLILVN